MQSVDSKKLADVMDTSQKSILEAACKRAMWNLSKMRSEHKLKITKWRQKINKHLQTIEDKLRCDLDEMHSATIDIIKESLRKHLNVETSLQDIEQELRRHVKKYTHDDNDRKVEVCEQTTQLINAMNQQPQLDTLQERVVKEETECCLNRTSEEKQDRDSDKYPHDVGIQPDVHISKQNNPATEVNFKDSSADTEPFNATTGNQVQTSEMGLQNEAPLNSVLNLLHSLQYHMQTNLDAEKVITDFPSLGSCSIEILPKENFCDVMNALRELRGCVVISHPVLQSSCVIRPKDDKKVPGYGRLILGGAAITAQNSVLLTDMSRQKLLECDTDGVIIKEVQMTLKPMALTFINDYELALSFTYNKGSSTIQILGTVDFEVQHAFGVPGKCRDMRFSDGSLYLACEEQVLVTDYYGTIMDRKYIDKSCIRYLCVDNHQRVYFTNWNTNTVHCIGSGNKEEVYTYKHPDLRGATSVEVDILDNCYVLGYISNNIHKLKPGGELLNIILSGGDGLCEPRLIAFHPCRNEFIIVDNSPECDFKIYQSALGDSMKNKKTAKAVKEGEEAITVKMC